MTIFALAGGSFIFIGVTIAFFFAVVYGCYTVSGINNHPNDGLDGAPGAAAPGEASAKAAAARTAATGSAPAATFQPTARAER